MVEKDSNPRFDLDRKGYATPSLILTTMHSGDGLVGWPKVSTSHVLVYCDGKIKSSFLYRRWSPRFRKSMSVGRVQPGD